VYVKEETVVGDFCCLRGEPGGRVLLILAIFVLGLTGCAHLREPNDAEVPRTINIETEPPAPWNSSATMLEEAKAAFDRGIENSEQGRAQMAEADFASVVDLLLEADAVDAVELHKKASRHVNIFAPLIAESKPVRTEPVIATPAGPSSGLGERLERGTYDLPVVLNDAVQREIELYEDVYRKAFELGLKRSGKHIERIRAILAHEGLPQDLAYLPLIESNFNPRAKSRVGAAGLWQFMESTGRNHGLRVDSWVDERYSLEKSTYAAIAYLSKLYNLFGSWEMALAAYNCGERRLQLLKLANYERDFWTLVSNKPASREMPRETRAFVPKIFAAIIVAKNPEKYGFTVEKDPPLRYDKMIVEGMIRLSDLAEGCGVTVQEMRELNPDLKRDRTPISDKPLELLIPLGTKESLQVALANMPPVIGVESFTHKIRKGDTLSRIATAYNTTVEEIMMLNTLRTTSIRAGDNIMVPGAAKTTSPGPDKRRASTPAVRETHDGSGDRIYVVRRNDTLWDIAQMFGVPTADLLRNNNLTKRNARRLMPGDKLRIPGQPAQLSLAKAPEQTPVVSEETFHTVKNGESLWVIARKYNVGVADIRKWNDLKGKLIHPGDKLVVQSN